MNGSRIDDDTLLSLRQIKYMQHAIGLDHCSGRLIKRGKHKTCRNYFDAGEEDPEWEDLVEKGMAIKHYRDGSYSLTIKGLEILERIMLIQIVKENL